LSILIDQARIIDSSSAHADDRALDASKLEEIGVARINRKQCVDLCLESGPLDGLTMYLATDRCLLG
jgi:hypothetical protein